MSTPRTLLVTGASGNLGRQAVEFLLARKADTVIAGSRDPQKLAALVAQGAQARALDFEKPETLPAAFAGVDRVLIISTDALDRPGRRFAQHQAAINAAVKAGVQHIIYTSFVNAVPGSAVLINPDHQQTEAALAASPIGHTILRNNLYAENLFGSLPHAFAAGQWFTAGATGKAGFVTRKDAARAAAAALASAFTGTRTLDITGPELLTHGDIARIASEIVGRPLSHVPVDQPSLVAGMVKAGLPEPIAHVYASFDVALAKGEFAVASNAIQELTGQAPSTLRDFFIAHQAALLGAS